MNSIGANPCQKHDCHLCCLDTQMTLTQADVVRLEGAGFREFCRQNRDFELVLQNRDGRCVFLHEGQCRAYEVRPEGCRLYPLVLDLSWNRVVCDDLCPHRHEFPIDGERSARLRRSVDQESNESSQRRRRDDG